MGKQDIEKMFQIKSRKFRDPKCSNNRGEILMKPFNKQNKSGCFSKTFSNLHFGKSNILPNGGDRRVESKNSFGNYKDTQWFKIKVIFGKKLERSIEMKESPMEEDIVMNKPSTDKSEIMNAILSKCKKTFISYNFLSHNVLYNMATFYINDPQAASEIQLLSKKVTTTDGIKMIIHCSKSLPPIITLNSHTMEKIMACIRKRYNSTVNCLDLTSFSSDIDLIQEGLCISMHRLDVMNAITKFIKENIPQIQQLDLSKNKLTNLNGLSSLVEICKDLKSLILKDNKLKHIAVLNALKGMDLHELVLDGNIFCRNFKDKSKYISAVREKFPRIIKLDGQELLAPILFSLGTENGLPDSKENSFPGEEVKTLIAQFLEQYYAIFDSSNRQPLLNAYHDQAAFSLSASKMFEKGWSIEDYVCESRNLMKVHDINARYKLLKKGRLCVISSLCQMPCTQHIPASFKIDASLVLPTMMMFTVTGVFKEVGDGKKPLRAFHRIFTVVPQGQGLSITNDMMQITNATHGQIQAFGAVTLISSDETKQQQLIVKFSNSTKMNLQFSEKCLKDFEWDYEKAMSCFQVLNAKGSIPKEAF